MGVENALAESHLTSDRTDRGPREPVPGEEPVRCLQQRPLGVTRFGFPWSSRPPCSGPTPTSLVHLLPPRVMIPSTPLTLIDRLLSFEAGAVPVRRLSLTLRKELTVTHDDASAHR